MTIFVRFRFWFRFALAVRWRPPAGVSLHVTVDPARRLLFLALSRCCCTVYTVVPPSAPVRSIPGVLDALVEQIGAAYDQKHADGDPHILNLSNVGRDQ